MLHRYNGLIKSKRRFALPTITIFCGMLLIADGAVGYWLQDPDNRSATALIPAGLGALLVILGLLANKPGLRKHAMHLAVILGLAGCVAGLARLVPKLISGEVKLLPGACLSIMIVVCAAFVGLCINSFIQARRARGAKEKV
jgi:hypothetical protein